MLVRLCLGVCVFVYMAIVSNAQFIRVRAICALALVIISSSSYGIHLGAAVFQLYHIHTSIHLSKQSSIHLLHGYTRMSTSTHLCMDSNRYLFKIFFAIYIFLQRNVIGDQFPRPFKTREHISYGIN